MDSLTLLSILWRRWFVVLPIALLTVAAGAVVASASNVRYETFGSELLVKRSQTGEQPSTAPLLSPEQLSSLAARSLLTPEFELELRESGFISDFEVIANPDSSTISLTVTGEDPNDVFEMTETILARAPAATEALLGADVAATFELSPLTAPTRDQIVEGEGAFVLNVPLWAWTSGANVSNPFPAGNSTLRTLGEIASRSALMDAVEEQIPSGSFAVSSEQRATAPIVSIRASADEAADVVLVYEIVREDLAQQLLDLQTSAGVAPADQTVLLQLVSPEAIEQTRSSTVRAAASILLLGLGFACLAAISIDLMAQRRKQRRSADRVGQVPTPMSDNVTRSDGDPATRSELEPPLEASVK